MFEINILHILVSTVLVMVILLAFDVCHIFNILVLKSIMEFWVIIFLTLTILGLKVFFLFCFLQFGLNLKQHFSKCHLIV